MMLDRLIQAVRTFECGDNTIREWSIFIAENRRMGLGTKDRQTGNVHAPLNLSVSCGARYLFVWSDGNVSRGYFERRQIEGDTGKALAQARLASYDDTDAACVLGPAAMPEVRIHDTQAASLAVGEVEMIAGRLETIRDMISNQGLRTWSGSFGASESSVRLVTSAGLDVEGQGTSFGWHVTFNGELGDGFNARNLDSGKEYRERLFRLAETVRRLEEPAAATEPGIKPVLLHPNVVESYVLGTLIANIQGAGIAHGEGHFRKDQFDRSEQVLREDIGLRIDPLQEFKSGSYSFTAEGVPAAPCTYIEAGKLVQPILNLKYARRLDRSPTPVPSGLDTVYLEGDDPIESEEAFELARGGVLVLTILGAHTQDSSSGDFSLSSAQTLRLEDDGPRGRLRVTLSGNLFELLRSPDLRFVRFAGEHTPGLLVHCRLDPK